VVSLEGVLFDASFAAEKGQFKMSGAEVAKTGPQTYRFERGRFTTCRCPEGGGREPWEIKAEKAELEVGGYGTARNTTFEVLGVPVAWVPWMIYPLKTERQTGLLFPEISAGSLDSFSAALPIFWAARENVNVLFTPGGSVERGFFAKGATEYVFGEQSQGRVAGAYHRDAEIDAHSPSEPFGRNRWATWGEQDLWLPGDVRVKSDFAFTSDNQYPSDFGELGRYRNDRFLESTAFASRTFLGDGRLGLVAAAESADDLQSPDDADRDDFVIQRVPQISAALLPAPAPFIGLLVPALDVQYTYFRSGESLDTAFLDTGIDALFDAQERGPDGQDPPGGADLNQDNAGLPGGTEGDGLFQEGEPLVDRGQRLWLTPRLGMPLRLGRFAELYPEAGWAQTFYDSEALGGEQHGFATARVELRTRLRRRFGDALTHLLEPRIGWAWVTDTSQSGDPLYVPSAAVAQGRLRELELESVTRDPADRIEEFNGVTFGFSNRFWGAGEGGAPRLVADAVLSGQYDFEASEFGLVVLDGRVYPFERTTGRVSLGFDPEDVELDEALVEVAQAFDAGHRVGIRYRYLEDVPRFFEDFPYVRERFRHVREEFDHVNQIDLYLRLSITETWAASYVGSYSFERSLVLRNRGGVEYFSRCRCWAVRVEVEQDRERGVQFNLLYTLAGLGDDRRSPFEPSGVPGFGLLD
jgi:lipopolysaccharide assembly outer membrane protein LptD (OstA)